MGDSVQGEAGPEVVGLQRRESCRLEGPNHTLSPTYPAVATIFESRPSLEYCGDGMQCTATQSPQMQAGLQH